MRRVFIVLSILSIAFIGALGLLWPNAWWAYAIVLPFVALGLYDMLQTRRTIMRNYPIVGRGRYWMEILRPKIYQYFVESDINGRPFDRVSRSVIYQRAKRELDTTPFGTQLDVYEVGYEWIGHSINPLSHEDLDGDPRETIGGAQCSKPYSSSLLNISAMSFGSLSSTAIEALNGGAKDGGFAHNTGEGGASPYHLKHGGDLIWQIGTGYFGCRNLEGDFDPAMFKDMAQREQVKMIELKLSQGAKPGHGGILPAVKNTPEIAKIRGVRPGTRVNSPPSHSAFSTPQGLLDFIAHMRELSGGKPVGFKLCMGKRSQFISLCQAMRKSGVLPDFISIDGGEGGTGAAPVEFSNAMGMPLKEGLVFAHDALSGHGLKDKIKLVASGKITNGFDIVRALGLGADVCNSARGMMIALGCIQALECNTNHCPTGVATQNPDLSQGLVVEDKRTRVRNYHHETVNSAVEIFAAAGFKTPAEVRRFHIFRRTSPIEIKRLDEIYPYVENGGLCDGACPERYQDIVRRADPTDFVPKS
jgi:glutamate synthase domain-containing protein 2